MSRTWILIADRSGARLFEQTREHMPIRLHTTFEHPAGRLREGEIYADRPGRVHDRMGDQRHGVGREESFTRECLALEVSTHINSNTVRTVLRRLFTTRAVPRFLRSDNGGEFIARSTAMLLHEAKCTARFIQPGKPWQNGFIESFHSTLRRDHLDVEVFFNLLDAQLKTGIYRNYYNQLRPHSALGYKAPSEYATMKAGSLM